MDREAINRLASQCPDEYPDRDNDWEEMPAVKALSAYLAKNGLPFLSKAVLGGKAWSRWLGYVNEEEVAILEFEASDPGFSWNRTNET